MSTNPEVAVAERRKFPRILYSVPVQILVRDKGDRSIGDAIMTVVCHDLSASGMRIFSTIPLDEKEIFVRFAAPNDDVAVKGARVVRVQHRNESLWEYGLQFDSPLDESMLEIN